MVMAYRSDVEALEARVHALSAELADRQRERDEVAAMLADARLRAHAESVIADLEAGGPARRRRKRIKLAAAVGAFVLAIAGFGYRVTRPHDDRIARVMAKYSAYADQMCGCTNSQCSQQVADDMTKWSQQMLKDDPSLEKPDKDAMKQAEVIAQRLMKCMVRAMQDQSAGLNANG
jgi:hypothetical protein